MTIHQAADHLRSECAPLVGFHTVGVGADPVGRPSLHLWMSPGARLPDVVAFGTWMGWPVAIRRCPTLGHRDQDPPASQGVHLPPPGRTAHPASDPGRR